MVKHWSQWIDYGVVDWDNNILGDVTTKTVKVTVRYVIDGAELVLASGAGVLPDGGDPDEMRIALGKPLTSGPCIPFPSSC